MYFYNLCLETGADIKVHDPWVMEYPGVRVEQDLESVLSDVDAVVVFTGHREYKGLLPGDVKESMGCGYPVVVDGRNIIDLDSWIQSGFVYQGIWRGDKN